VIAGLISFETSLRHFRYQTEGKNFEFRQYDEGISVSHFVAQDPAPMNLRLTGNEQIPGAPVLLIVGDSYITARQVRDEQTMGSIIERRSRAEGYPLNVRQYGVPGASIPAYIGFANLLLKRWKPRWVIVAISANDLQSFSLARQEFWGMRARPDGSTEIFRSPVRHVPSRIKWLLGSHLALVRTLYERYETLIGVPLDLSRVSLQDVERIPEVTMPLLKKAYGDKLLIVYIPESTMLTRSQATMEEKNLEQACIKCGVPYVSCHSEFTRMREQFIYPKGFHNTLPGDGHLNIDGHRAVAEIMWRLIQQAQPRTNIVSAGQKKTSQ